MGNWFSAAQQPQAQGSNSLCDPPWSLEARYLESWYNENIQRGTATFDRECREAIAWVVRYLHEECSSNRYLFDVDRVIKGGSFGKGTMVQDKSDVDLVAFINPPHMKPMWQCQSADEYRDKLKVVLDSLTEALNRLNEVTVKKTDAYLINFDSWVGGRQVSVDLLPTADNVLGYGPSGIFKEMLQTSRYDRGFYSASLVKLQRDFVRDQPGYVKELIRFVKYWAYTQLPDYLQKSYPLELITIYRWEVAGKPSRFEKAQGLKDILQTLTNLQEVRYYWTKYYDDEMAEQGISQYRNPVVLDPANPTNNACYAYWGEKKTKMESVALSTLQCTLLRGVTVRSNWRN